MTLRFLKTNITLVCNQKTYSIWHTVDIASWYICRLNTHVIWIFI